MQHVEIPTPQPIITPPSPASPQDRLQQIQRVAGDLINKEADWVTFFREVLGAEGIVKRLYPSPDELEAFERTPEYDAIQKMLAQLRRRVAIKPEEKEPTRVITVRMPLSLHTSLRSEAHEKQTSMNKLCISKLLQIIDKELIPVES